MADPNRKKELADLIDKASRALAKQKGERAVRYGVHHPNYHEYLNILLDGHADSEQRDLLKKLARAMHEMGGSDYEAGAYATLIRLYADLGWVCGGKLLPEVHERFDRMVNKEVRFVKMRDPDNADLRELGDRATGAVANQQPHRGEPDEEGKLLNAFLIEILDYRLATLDEEAAWDFAAQAILNETKISS